MHLQLSFNPSCKRGEGLEVGVGVGLEVGVGVDTPEQSQVTTRSLHRTRSQMPSLGRDLLYDLPRQRTRNNPGSNSGPLFIRCFKSLMKIKKIKND